MPGPVSGSFEVFFRNLAACLNESAELSGWKTQVVPRAESRRLASGVKSAFEAPSFVGKNLHSALARFKRRLEIKALIGAYSGKLAEYSGLIAGADIVHAHDPFAALAFVKMKRSKAGAKLCLTPGYISGLDETAPERPWLMEAEAEAMELADFLMVPSCAYFSALNRVYGPLKKNHVVLPGLEDSKHIKTGILRERLRVPPSALLVTAFYGPGAASDADFFLEAFALARSKVPGRIFGLISGLKTTGLEDRIKALDLEGSFAMLEPDAPDWDVLAETDIFFSAFSRPLVELGTIEAFRAGVAVVAADDGWNAEAAGYGEAAMLFKSGEAASAGSALAEIAGHPSALIHFSAKARDYFKVQYSLDALAGRAARAYSEMVGAETREVKFVELGRK